MSLNAYIIVYVQASVHANAHVYERACICLAYTLMLISASIFICANIK